jgi:hypothetical protein
VRLFADRSGARVDLATTAATALALGLAWVQAGAMLLGFVDLLLAPAIAAWIGLGAFASAWAWRRGISSPEAEPALRGPLLAGTAVLVVYLLLASVPPWYRDSMVYHLALPRAFAMHGGYVRPDDNIFASFPLGYESFLAALHAFGPGPDRFPPFNPRLPGAWIAAAAALATMGLARQAGANARYAGWSGVLLLLVPTLLEFGPSAYVEPYLILLGTLALGGVLRLSRGEPKFLLPAALFAGLAASVKYPGLAVVAILAVLLLAQGVGRGPEVAREAMRRTATFLAIAVAVGSPFYVRNIVERGNPLFPLAYGLFGGTGWDEWRSLAYDVTLSHYGAGRDSVDWLLLPLRTFTWRDMVRGFEGSIGPVVGLGVLGYFFRRKEGPRLGPGLLFAFVLAWFGFWAATVQQSRFFLVAVPPALALGTIALGRLGETRPRAAGLALTAALVLSVGWATEPLRFLWNRQQTSAWLEGTMSREELLSRLLPESYAFEADLEKHVPPDGRVWLVWTRGYTYYLRRPYRLDSVFEAYRFEELLDRQGADSSLLDSLAADGISHVLVHGRFFLVDDNADLGPGRTTRLRARFDRLRADGRLVPAATWGDITLYLVNAT